MVIYGHLNGSSRRLSSKLVRIKLKAQLAERWWPDFAASGGEPMELDECWKMAAEVDVWMMTTEVDA